MKNLFIKDEFTKSRIILAVTCVFTLMLFVTGCSKPTHVATCKVDVGSIRESIKLNAQEDELTMTVSEVTVVYEKLGLSTDEDKIALQNNLSNQFVGVEGIKIENMQSTETELTYLLTVDYSTVDYNKLIEFGLMQPVDGEMPESVSFTKSVEGMKSNGYICE